MKAVVLRRFGAPDVMTIEDVPRPSVGKGEVIVRVKAIGLNFAELFARMGVYPGIPSPPFTPGIEFSGIVSEIGRNVRTVKKGSRVFGFTRQGSYAEYVKTPADHLMKIPSAMSIRDAAAFPVAAFSAYHGLVTLANIRKGEKLLLHSAAGGVGLTAVQLAKHLGAEVYGTAGSSEKTAIVLKYGADHAMNYRNQDFADFIRRESNGYGVDVVMDSVGGSLFRKGWNLLAPMGRYVLYGFASAVSGKSFSRLKAYAEAARVPWIYPPSIVSKNVTLHGFNLYFLSHKTVYFRRIGRELLRLYEGKIIRPHVGAVYPFEKIVAAHEFLHSRKSIGKVIVEI